MLLSLKKVRDWNCDFHQLETLEIIDNVNSVENDNGSEIDNSNADPNFQNRLASDELVMYYFYSDIHLWTDKFIGFTVIVFELFSFGFEDY